MSAQLFTRAAAFAEARAELAAAATMGMAPSERTLAVQILASMLVDTISGSLRSGDGQIVYWIDRICDTYVDQPGISSFLNTVCASLETFLSANGGSERERRSLRELDPQIRALARKPRSGIPPAPEHLNETDALINQLLSRLDRADPLTAEHSRAVAVWSARIARRLTLRESEVVFASRCGMIHDVGKMTTPPEILNAPRKLTPEEWKIMQQHTTSGQQIILLDETALMEFAPAVRSHHERLDGAGYPDGRGREEIPLATRIVSVADSFNAMIGRRPYRPALPVSVALDELTRYRGTQFDPDVVEAMHAVVSSR